MRRFFLIIGIVVCGLLGGLARGETFKLANGQEVVGELLPTSANDQGVQVKVGEGQYQKVDWGSFTQEDIRRFARNPKLQAFVEPYVEVSTEEKVKRTEPNMKPPERLPQVTHQSLLGAMFTSGLGVVIMLLLYAANLYAGYEIAIFRAQPPPLVCGISAVVPLIGPIVFLSMPTRMRPGDEAAATAAAPEGAAEGAPAAAAAGSTGDTVNPMQADGAAHPSALKLAHEEPKSSLPETVTYQRGQYTFNRRFIETKFAGFFGVVRRDAEKDLVLAVKASRGEYVGQRISRIAANDLHLEVKRGGASEEVMIPFQEIQQIQVRHKDAK